LFWAPEVIDTVLTALVVGVIVICELLNAHADGLRKSAKAITTKNALIHRPSALLEKEANIIMWGK